MTTKLRHRWICAHARAHMHFLQRVCMHLDRCCEHHACARVYVRRVLRPSAYTFANTLATGCAHALMYVQFDHWALGERGWEGSTSLWKHSLLEAGWDLGLTAFFLNTYFLPKKKSKKMWTQITDHLRSQAKRHFLTKRYRNWISWYLDERGVAD